MIDSPEVHRLFDRVADRVVRARMTTPVLLFLETSAPLHFVTSQVMVGATPLVSLFVPAASWERVARALEERGAVERLIAAIETRARS